MIEAKAIDHICLWVRSLTEAKLYYEQLFGFLCTPKKNDENTMCVESNSVHFFISEKSQDDDFIANQHISFEVASLREVIDNLHKAGINDYETGKTSDFLRRNYAWCEWRDPSGIRLECVEHIKDIESSKK